MTRIEIASNERRGEGRSVVRSFFQVVGLFLYLLIVFGVIIVLSYMLFKAIVQDELEMAKP